MDEATQQNAALVEEASAAAESMQEQAQNLAQAVAVFKLAQHEERATVVAKAEKPRASVTQLPRKALAKGPLQWRKPLRARSPTPNKATGVEEFDHWPATSQLAVA